MQYQSIGFVTDNGNQGTDFFNIATALKIQDGGGQDGYQSVNIISYGGNNNSVFDTPYISAASCI